MHATFAKQLAEQLRSAGRLPGPAAQRQMAPELSYGRHFAPPPDNARRAAVMVLLYQANGHWSLPLIVRPEHLEHHAGQVALPGGLIEPGESSWQAAARELEEELGVPMSGIEPLGQLSPLYIYGSNHNVETWVVLADRQPLFAASADEVAEILEVPLPHLLDPASRGRETRTAHGVQFRAPFFSWGSQRIWGATAMILAELLTVIQEPSA